MEKKIVRRARTTISQLNIIKNHSFVFPPNLQTNKHAKHRAARTQIVDFIKQVDADSREN